MNENQLKTKIFVLKAIDTILITGLLVTVAYTVFYAEEKEFMIFVCLVTLALVSLIGRSTKNMASILGVQLQILLRDKKREQQRTLMGTRNTKPGGTRATSVNTDSSTKK